MINSHIFHLLMRIADEGSIHVFENEDDEAVIPGVTLAIERGLIRRSVGVVGAHFELTVLGKDALGLPVGRFERFMASIGL